MGSDGWVDLPHNEGSSGRKLRKRLSSAQSRQSTNALEP